MRYFTDYIEDFMNKVAHTDVLAMKPFDAHAQLRDPWDR